MMLYSCGTVKRLQLPVRLARIFPHPLLVWVFAVLNVQPADFVEPRVDCLSVPLSGPWYGRWEAVSVRLVAVIRSYSSLVAGGQGLATARAAAEMYPKFLADLSP